MKIVLAGPPKSGKSCLREGLKVALRRLDDHYYPYVITANPDGEGAWFQETYAADRELAQSLKVDKKRPWSPEVAELFAAWVRNCNEPLALIDIGGVPDGFNESICGHATHIVVLYPNPEALAVWREFGRRLGLTLAAEIESDYHGQADRVDGVGEDGVLRGAVHYLERGAAADKRPMVVALARHLLALAAP